MRDRMYRDSEKERVTKLVFSGGISFADNSTPVAAESRFTVIRSSPWARPSRCLQTSRYLFLLPLLLTPLATSAPLSAVALMDLHFSSYSFHSSARPSSSNVRSPQIGGH